MGLTKPKVTGVELPALSNAATAEHIKSGFEAIDGLGNLIVGVGNFAEIVSGQKTGSYSNTLTVAELIGKNNFIVSGMAALDGSGNKAICSAFCIDGTMGAIVSNSSTAAGFEAITFDNTTGKIKCTNTSPKFARKAYCYIGW